MSLGSIAGTSSSRSGCPWSPRRPCWAPSRPPRRTAPPACPPESDSTGAPSRPGHPRPRHQHRHTQVSFSLGLCVPSWRCNRGATQDIHVFGGLVSNEPPPSGAPPSQWGPGASAPPNGVGGPRGSSITACRGMARYGQSGSARGSSSRRCRRRIRRARATPRLCDRVARRSGPRGRRSELVQITTSRRATPGEPGRPRDARPEVGRHLLGRDVLVVGRR